MPYCPTRYLARYHPSDPKASRTTGDRLQILLRAHRELSLTLLFQQSLTPISSQPDGIEREVVRELAELESDLHCVNEWWKSTGWGPKDLSSMTGTGRDGGEKSSMSVQLDRLDVSSAVCLRDCERSSSVLNSTYREWFSVSDEVPRKRSEVPNVQWCGRLDELSERLLRSGAICLRFEHQGPTRGGQWYHWATIKARLSTASYDEFGTLTVMRPIVAMSQPMESSLAYLEEQLSQFRRLDGIDREICQGIALGDSSGEIAHSVGLTRRTVEIRRGKILEHFGFYRPVQIVRLIVRLEENGLLDEN